MPRFNITYSAAVVRSISGEVEVEAADDELARAKAEDLVQEQYPEHDIEEFTTMCIPLGVEVYNGSPDAN